MFGNKLNSTLTKVTKFIVDLEKGIKENADTILVNTNKITEIAEKESQEIVRIKTKAADERSIVGNKNVILIDQSTLAKKLLSKLQ